MEVYGYVDPDFAGDQQHVQSIVALSSTEAEYVAATEAIKEALWLQGLLKELEVLHSSY